MLIAFLTGNLGKDPEARFSPSGQKITTFSVASNTKRQGEEETTWYRITVFGDRLDKMISYLKKGSYVIITGELTTRLWTDKEGRPQIQNEIIADTIKFAPSRPDRQDQAHGQTQNYSSNAAPASTGYPSGYAPQSRPTPAPSFAQPQQFAAQAPEYSFEPTPHDSHVHEQHHDEPPF